MFVICVCFCALVWNLLICLRVCFGFDVGIGFDTMFGYLVLRFISLVGRFWF